MTGFRVVVDLSQFRDMLAKVPGAIDRAVELTALEAWRNVAIESPVDHGRLRSSWQLRRTGIYAWEVYSGVDYVEHVIRGHGEIVPVRAKVLRFRPKGSGQFVFAHRVRAVPPNPFIDRAVTKTELRVPAFAAIAFRELGEA